MLERGIAARQGIGFLRMELLTILTTRTDACRHGCWVLLRSWQATGAGSVSASMAYPARSKLWLVKIRHVCA